MKYHTMYMPPGHSLKRVSGIHTFHGKEVTYPQDGLQEAPSTFSVPSHFPRVIKNNI